MSKYIDIEYLKKKKRFLTAQQRYIVRMTDVYTAPSIDIVRCKECEHYEPYSASCNISNGLRNANADGFCSYGERGVE